MKQTPEPIRLPAEPMIPAPDGEAGIDFCQICGGKTKFIGGPSYDVENYECNDCKALHNVRVEYHRGRVSGRMLESVY